MLYLRSLLRVGLISVGSLVLTTTPVLADGPAQPVSISPGYYSGTIGSALAGNIFWPNTAGYLYGRYGYPSYSGVFGYPGFYGGGYGFSPFIYNTPFPDPYYPQQYFYYVPGLYYKSYNGVPAQP
jgi:hypothetical protein